MDVNTPPGAKLGLCQITIYSKFFIAHKFFIGGPFEAQIMIWRQIQIFSPNRRALFHSTPEGPIDRATKF